MSLNRSALSFAFLADIWQDLRYACRTLLRSRSFVILSTLMLALGIGAHTAIFSVVLTVLIRPLPYADAERVVWLSNRNPALGVSGAFLNPADILDFREQSQSFEHIAAWGAIPVNLYGARSLERVEGVYVTPDFFRTLGVRPQLGRDFAEVNEPENSAIISHALWLRQFGGDQTVIGRKISLGFNPTSTDAVSVIVGVLPADTNFPARVDLFTVAEIEREDSDRGGAHNLRTIGRLKPGVSIEQAQAEMSTLTQRKQTSFPIRTRVGKFRFSHCVIIYSVTQAPRCYSYLAQLQSSLLSRVNVANLQLGERHGTPQMFVINEAFARTYLPGREAIGVRLEGDSELVKGEIVGVVASIKHTSLELNAEPALYVSYLQSTTFPIMNFVVKTKTDPASLIIPVQQNLQALDPRGVVFNVRPFDQFVADAVAPRRFNLWLFTAFGLLAGVLAAAGIYATMNFAVVQRNREIGIRMALGAQKSAVMKLILGEGAILVSTGLVTGFSASLALNQLMKSLLFAVSETDPLIYFLMATLVVGITLVASSIPARRATKIDPIQTLRSD